MKALSICQPFAQLVVSGAKCIETRSWKTAYRGRLAIHASGTFTPATHELCQQPPFAAALARAGIPDPGELARGALIGVVELLECRRVEDLPPTLLEGEEHFGDFRPGRWGWILGNASALLCPVSCKGTLGLFDVADDLAQLLRCA